MEVIASLLGLILDREDDAVDGRIAGGAEYGAVSFRDNRFSDAVVNFCVDDGCTRRVGAVADLLGRDNRSAVLAVNFATGVLYGGVSATAGLTAGLDKRSNVSTVNRVAADRLVVSAGGLKRGGGKVSTVGDEISVDGDDILFLALVERTLSNLGEDMDKGDGVGCKEPPPALLVLLLGLAPVETDKGFFLRLLLLVVPALL